MYDVIKKRKTRNVVRIILSIFFVISVFVSFIAGVVAVVFSNVDMMKKSVVTDKYIDSLYSAISLNLEYECLSLSVDYGSIAEGVDKEILRTLSEQYYENVGNAVLHNVEMKEIAYPQDKFLERVRDFFAAYQQENAVTIPEGQDIVIASGLAKVVAGDICIFGQNITTRFAPVTSAIEALLSVLRVILFVAIVLSLGLGVLIFFTGSKSRPKKFFQLAAPLFIVASLIFAPFASFVLLDPMKNLAIGASPLREAVTGYFNTAFSNVFVSALIFFIITAVLLVCSIVFSSRIKTSVHRSTEDGSPEA